MKSREEKGGGKGRRRNDQYEKNARHGNFRPADLSHTLFPSIFSRSKFIPIDAVRSTCFSGGGGGGAFYYSHILCAVEKTRTLRAPSPSLNWRVIMSNYFVNRISEVLKRRGNFQITLHDIADVYVYIYVRYIGRNLKYTSHCCAYRIKIFLSLSFFFYWYWYVRFW